MSTENPQDRMALVIEGVLKSAVDEQIDTLRDRKYVKGDYFGVLQVSICGHAKLDRDKKIEMLKVIDAMEYDMYEITGLLDATSPPRDEYLAKALANHISTIDQIETKLDYVNRKVEDFKSGKWKEDERVH